MKNCAFQRPDITSPTCYACSLKQKVQASKDAKREKEERASRSSSGSLSSHPPNQASTSRKRNRASEEVQIDWVTLLHKYDELQRTFFEAKATIDQDVETYNDQVAQARLEEKQANEDKMTLFQQYKAQKVELSASSARLVIEQGRIQNREQSLRSSLAANSIEQEEIIQNLKAKIAAAQERLNRAQEAVDLGTQTNHS